MKSATKHLLLLSGIAMIQTSCSLPPSQAWKIVNSQGLIPYIAMETGRRPFPAGVTPIRRQSTPDHKPVGLAQPSTSPTANRYLSAPSSAPAPAVVAPRALPAAAANTPAPALAPTPKLRLTSTAPKPRMSAAPKPPVKKVTEAPAPAKPAPRKAVSAPVKAPVKATPAPVAKPTPKPSTPSAPKPQSPAPTPKSVAPKTPAPTPATTPTPKPSPAPAAKPEPKAAPAPAPAAEKSSASGIPYGSPIPGRPGLVNSPYAGKHQIVDVSGLQSGQEIKCPYSGRLFLVPPGQVSANKATAPGAPKP